MPVYRSAAIIALGIATSAQAEPLVRYQTSYYYIEGNSAVLLTEQIGQKGPEGIDGKRHPTRTKWNVQWKFRHNPQGGVCKMEEVAVAVAVTTMRPRWRGESNGPPGLRERWRRLMEAVESNQEFHRSQAVAAGNEIEAALMNVKPAPDCDAQTEVANETANAILRKYLSRSEMRDSTTDYGRKEGASLL